jgi:uncharacterized membrane protein YczE
LGLFLYALGIAITMKANIGYAPWEVFHAGISNAVGISIGTVSIITGFCIVILAVLLGEKFGLGTILNMILIGVFLDLILGIKGLPLASGYFSGVGMMILGLYIIALGSYFYIGSGFGAGPRDSLMVALKRKTGLPIGLCRGMIEVSAVLIGWILGGLVGVGTIISALAIGFCVQSTFKILRFEATTIQHETLIETLSTIKGGE